MRGESSSTREFRGHIASQPLLPSLNVEKMEGNLGKKRIIPSLCLLCNAPQPAASTFQRGGPPVRPPSRRGLEQVHGVLELRHGLLGRLDLRLVRRDLAR